MSGEASPEFLAGVLVAYAPLINARVAQTGRPREIYETYLTRPPRPGQSWEDALYGRSLSLGAGPLPEPVRERLHRQVRASSPQAHAA